MRSTCLQGFAILHHGFDRIGIERTGKTFAVGLHALDHRHSHVVFCKVGINALHLLGFDFSLFAGCMSRMTLLPQELSRTQEETCTHLPTHDVGPLVAQDGQVTVRLDPILIGVPNDSFGGRTDNQFLFEASCRIDHNPCTVVVGFQTIVCYDCTLFGETFHVFCFATQE